MACSVSEYLNVNGLIVLGRELNLSVGTRRKWRMETAREEEGKHVARCASKVHYSSVANGDTSSSFMKNIFQADTFTHLQNSVYASLETLTKNQIFMKLLLMPTRGANQRTNGRD